MKTHSLYDAETGLFFGKTISCTDNLLGINTPAGSVPAEGLHDHLSKRVDLEATAAAQALLDAEQHVYVPVPQQDGMPPMLSQAISTARKIADPVIVDYQPPSPGDDKWLTWAWNDTTKRWVSTRTEASIAREARAARDALLATTDWTVIRAIELSQATHAPVSENAASVGLPDAPAAAPEVTAAFDWPAYRQALRDIPTQPGFPTTISWPDLPPEA